MKFLTSKNYIPHLDFEVSKLPMAFLKEQTRAVKHIGVDDDNLDDLRG